MDVEAMQSFRAQLEALSAAERLRHMKKIAPIEIAGKQAVLLASPLFLLPKHYDNFIRATELFVNATVAIETHEQFRRGNVLFDALHESLSAHGKRLIDRSEKPDSRAAVRRFRRLDGYMLKNSDPNFIEMNQSAPLAISFYERARMLTSQLGEACESLDLYDALAAWFVNEAARFGLKRSTLTVAVSMERGYPAKFIDLPVACKAISNAAKKHGVAIQFMLAEPTDFDYENNVPRVNERPFDLLWRNTVYLQNYDEPLFDYEAIRYGSTPMVNDLWAWLFRSKAFFAMIWDDSLRDEFAQFGVNVASLRRMTPETKWLSCAAEITNKNEWILKRCDDGFGRGIVFGSELSEREWRAYCRGEHGNDWIVQKIVHPEAIALPIIDNAGEIHDIEMTCDLDPFVVNGNVAGILVRALSAEKTNRKMNIVSGAAIGHVSVRRA